MEKVPAGPTGSSQNSSQNSGPTGTVEGVNTRISTFTNLLESLFKITDNVIADYIGNKEINDITYKELGYSDETDVGIQQLNTEYNSYKSGFQFKKTNSDIVLKYYLASFNKILEDNTAVLLQTMNDDSWIKKRNPTNKRPLEIMFGDVKGAVSTLRYRLGMFYKMACVLKTVHEKKMAEYPDIVKANNHTKYQSLLITTMFRIFKLTDKGQDPETIKSINIVIGGTNHPAEGLNNIFNSVKPLLGIGSDMMNKHLQEKNPNSNVRVAPNHLENIFSKVFASDGIKNMFNDIQESRADGRPPDISALINKVLTNINPTEMMNNLKNTAEEEIPGFKELSEKEKANNTTKKEETDNKAVEEDVLEEVIEETIEEIEEKD